MRKIKSIDIKLALLLIAPALVDVLLQLSGIKESTNLLRVTTGALLGLAISAYLIPRAQEGIRRLITEGIEVPKERVEHV